MYCEISAPIAPMQEAANFMAITKGCGRDSVTLFELGLVTRKNKTVLLSGPDIYLALQG